MDPWKEYEKELSLKDVEPATKTRYLQVIKAFRVWLGGEPPTPERAREYLAHLRDKGYRPASVLLYYHALQGFFEVVGERLKLKLRRPKTLPPYCDNGDIQRLIAQAEKGLRRQPPKVRQRNTAIILLLAYAGLRRGEVVGLRVRNLDFNQRLIRVLGKGGKERIVPMAERLVVPLRFFLSGEASRGGGVKAPTAPRP